MTSTNYFGKMISTLGSVVPLAMFGIMLILGLSNLASSFLYVLPEVVHEKKKHEEMRTVL